MSDLIIKPSGTGASLKIQNPSGTNKIVMNSSGTITTGTLGSGVTFPAGHVLQVKSASMGDALSLTSITAQTWTDIAGLSVQITPKFSSSKIMVFASVKGNTAQNVMCFLKTLRDSTEVGIGNTQGSFTRCSGALKEISSYDIGSTDWNFIDSPTIPDTPIAITYKVQVYTNGTVYINRPTVAADNYSVGSAHSSMTVMEIKQ